MPDGGDSNIPFAKKHTITIYPYRHFPSYRYERHHKANPNCEYI